MTKLAKQYENLLAYIYKHIRLYVLQHACNIENKNFAVYFRQNLESVFFENSLVVFSVGGKVFLFRSMFNRN